jgi:hypothetical protein
MVYHARVEKEEKFYTCRLIDFPHLITLRKSMEQLLQRVKYLIIVLIPMVSRTLSPGT